MGVVNKATREITWTKPLEMADPEEKIARIDAQAKQYAFFKDMEENIRRHMRNGFRSKMMCPFLIPRMMDHYSVHLTTIPP